MAPFFGGMSDGNNNLGPAAIVAVGRLALGGQVASAGGQVANALSASGSPADRLAACAVDWTHEISTPWHHKLLPVRRWTPSVPRAAR